MELLDGQKLSAQILSDLKKQVAGFKTPPRLVIVLVGNDPASAKYVQLKSLRAAEIGINCQIVTLPVTASQLDVEETVAGFSHNPDVHALMVQLPLPKSINSYPVVNSIAPHKDVDGLTALNLGKLFQKDPSAIIPATPLGIIRLLESYQVPLSGSSVVVVGRSPIVGLPLIALLEQRQATVTLCHSQTSSLSDFTRRADIIISAAGRPKLITAEMVKKGAAVVDVGSARVEGQLVGDVDYFTVAPHCSFITPNPGGVGPMTVACLLENIVKLAVYNNS